MHFLIELGERIIGHARKLAEYEKGGKPLTDPPAKVVLARFQKMKKGLVGQGIETAMHDGMTGVRAASTRRSKQAAFSKMRSKIIRLGKIAEKYNVALGKKQKAIIGQTQIREIIYQGSAADFDGDMASALVFFRKGLSQLLTDDIDDALQMRELRLLKENIARIEEQS